MHKKKERKGEQFISLEFENIKTKHKNFNYRPLKSQTRELFLCTFKELITNIAHDEFHTLPNSLPNC